MLENLKKYLINYGLFRLSKQELSVAEIERGMKRNAKLWLKKKNGLGEVTTEEIEKTIHALLEEWKENAYVSDDRYKAASFRSHLNKKEGFRKFQFRLRGKGIKIDEAEYHTLFDKSEALGLDNTGDESQEEESNQKDEKANSEAHSLASIKQLIEKKYPDFKEDHKTKARAVRGLLSKGFSYTHIKKVMESL